MWSPTRLHLRTASLFLIYINNLPNCLTVYRQYMFADDTNVTIEGKSVVEIENKLNIDLEKMHQWFLANKLTLNKGKTKYMVIGSKQRLANIESDPNIKLGETCIKRSKTDKDFRYYC